MAKAKSLRSATDKALAAEATRLNKEIEQRIERCRKIADEQLRRSGYDPKPKQSTKAGKT